MPTTTLHNPPQSDLNNESTPFDPIPGAAGRRVALLAVHHVAAGGQTLTGGAEKYTRTVIRRLMDAGATVHVGYSGTAIYDDLLERYHPRKLTVEHTGWIDECLSGDSRLRIDTIRDRRRWLRSTQADTLFAVQQASGGAFGASLVAARSLGLRVAVSLRQRPEPIGEGERKRYFGVIPSLSLWRRRLIWRRRLPALCCHALIYNSRRVADAYGECYGFPAGRSHVIYNGEFTHDTPPAGRTPRTIGCVGRVTEAKGADVMLDAFTIVARRHPACRLAYYGDGPMASVLAARARVRGLGDRVVMAGYQPDRGAIYSDVDICVQPSRRESMSNSVIEAMARGIPCVVTDVGGMREAVENEQSGFVVPQDDPAACAEAICKLLEDQSRYARFSKAARRRTQRDFDICILMRRTIEVILGL
ncbi:MAG: glycosyltransferase family 4 protein [Phycisphaerae bacterium]